MHLIKKRETFPAYLMCLCLLLYSLKVSFFFLIDCLDSPSKLYCYMYDQSIITSTECFQSILFIKTGLALHVAAHIQVCVC